LDCKDLEIKRLQFFTIFKKGSVEKFLHDVDFGLKKCFKCKKKILERKICLKGVFAKNEGGCRL